MSFQEPITIRVPQRTPRRRADVRKLEHELASVARAVNETAGHEILRVQGGGRQQLYVVVRDPHIRNEGFTYTFTYEGCDLTSLASLEPDSMNWDEACEHIVVRLQLLLDTISKRLTRQAKMARALAGSLNVSSQPVESQAPPASDE